MTRVQVVRPSELGPGEIAAWHQMQKSTPSLDNPLLSPEYAIAAGRFQARSRVAVLIDGQSTVGFFPFEARRFGVGVPVSGWLSTCQGVIHQPGAQWDTRDLLHGCGLSAWHFDNLIAEQEPFRRYCAEIAAAPAIDLSAGFGAYHAELRARAPRFCRELERKARKLGHEGGELRLDCDSRDPALLDRLIAWKSAQYRRTAHVNRFGFPWVAGLVRALLASRCEHLTGMLSVLYTGDHPVAMQFGLHSNRTLIGWLTGYDPAFCKYSPGVLQIRMMAEVLGDHNIDLVHMGKGAKLSARAFKNREIWVGAGTVTSRTPLGIAHRVLDSVSRGAVRASHQYPAVHHAADQVLRRTGIASRLYGKV